jgi:beta-N-acetylhexosaminidase
MVGHLIVPAIEPDPNRPASVSAHVIRDLLQGQLGFKGLVITDGLDMAGLTHVFTGSEAEISSEAAVAAVEAGEDMVIIPGDLGGAYDGLLAAVKKGEISEARIDESVLKILRMKASVGLDRNRFVDLAKVQDEIAQPQNMALAESVADRAVTLVEDGGKLIPIAAQPMDTTAQPGRPASRIVAVIFSDRPRGSEGGRAFANELRKRAPAATVFFVDPSNSGYVFDSVLAAVRDAGAVIAVAESVPNPRRTTEGHAGGSVGLNAGPMQLLTEIVKTAGAKTIVVAFGDPYTGGSIPGIETYVCTYSNTVVSATSLARALFGEIPIHGRLPVSIPNLAPRGTGLDRDAIARASTP